jgi:hypothetical protein
VSSTCSLFAGNLWEKGLNDILDDHAYEDKKSIIAENYQNAGYFVKKKDCLSPLRYTIMNNRFQICRRREDF